MGKISNYNSWVYSLSKFKFILLVLITSILQTFALAVLPSIIDNNYNNIIMKSIIIIIFLLVANFTLHLNLYKKNNSNK